MVHTYTHTLKKVHPDSLLLLLLPSPSCLSSPTLLSVGYLFLPSIRLALKETTLGGYRNHGFGITARNFYEFLYSSMQKKKKKNSIKDNTVGQ
ncbi:hypothetical protein BY458DRAFT_509440 [Sporodiniella umbellata]|nr:hypothetical protein BY458DRAFT_509440 [Sporodiniella umbellata]